MPDMKELWVRIALAGDPSMNHIEPLILCDPATAELSQASPTTAEFSQASAFSVAAAEVFCPLHQR